MTDYTDLQKAAEYAAQDTIKFADEGEEMRALQQFHEEVDPETVLALIADLDEARNGMKHSCAIRLKKEIEQLETERDQLKSENEALVAAAQALRDEWRKDQADAERYRWLRVKQTFIWLIQDWFPRNNVLTDVDAEIDAAMGEGEQS